MTLRGALQPAACLLALSLLTGCAAHPPGNRFIRPGEPTTDIGDPIAPLKEESLEQAIARTRKLAAEARPTPRPDGPLGIEGTDPALKAALGALAVSVDPAHERAVANAYLRVGVLDAAHDHFTRAIALDPSDASAHDGLARIWRTWGFPALALPSASRAVYYAPASPEARNTMGTVLQALGQRRNARQAYERALQLEPTASYALNNLCYVLFLEGERRMALSACRRALQLTPTLVAARNNVALTHAASGDLVSAARDFAASGDEAAARYNMGIVRLARREFKEAAQLFDEAARLRPSLALAARRADQARRLDADAHRRNAR